ncbi:MAG TPA: cupredoxin domain-containing protein [Patescibacteria group bacterium]|nr:cupredoxin domain-containing protein [Patescibacteria group bacterium]
MSITSKVIIAIVAVIVLGSGGYAVFHRKSATPAANNQTSSTTAPQSPSSTTAAVPAATITFTDNGFSPTVTTVKVGDTVQVTNKSSQPVQFDSDPHPAHTDEPELNVGEVEPGQSQTFVVTKAGHWGFHDHLDPSFTGKLNVQ